MNLDTCNVYIGINGFESLLKSEFEFWKLERRIL